MALPYSNTTCDVYRAGNAPPAAPDLPGVKCYLNPSGASTLTTQNYTHLLLVGPGVDIRDGGGYLNPGTNPDTVYVPDLNGVAYTVILVRRKGRGTALDLKEVLLKRTSSITWPTDNV
jgi:hypothetical protein